MFHEENTQDQYADWWSSALDELVPVFEDFNNEMSAKLAKGPKTWETDSVAQTLQDGHE